MKQTFRGIISLLSISIIFAACSSSSNTATAPRKDVKGTWTLTNVSYSGVNNAEQLRVKLFDDANSGCFEGSTWVLPNNGYGSYTINKATTNCTTGIRNIIWSYRTENGETIFQFKKLQEGEKAKNVEDGYRMKIISATAEALSLQSTIAFEGKDLVINYNFARAQTN